MKQMQLLRINYYERKRNNVPSSNVIAAFVIIVVIDAATTVVYQLSEHVQSSMKKNAISTPKESKRNSRSCEKKGIHRGTN